MVGKGRLSLLDIPSVQDDMTEYLELMLAYHIEKKHSRQTVETLLSAMSKFEYAINYYIQQNCIDSPLLDTATLRRDFYSRSKKHLRKSSRSFDCRAYPDPIRLIAAIHDGTYQLQAALQYEGGLRTEGVGSPSHCVIKNPLTATGLRGIGSDPVTGAKVGIVASKEKGGKFTEHYVSTVTYRRLEEYIQINVSLESKYSEYLAAVNRAAKATGQYAAGRGTHALKHSFAQERYLECVKHGMTHEQALQVTSLESSHFRLRETLTYTRG
jgi:integrase